MTEIKRIEQIAYHRNGVCGVPFYAVIFTSKQDRKVERFVASVFPDSGCVSVIGLDRALTTDGVTFSLNSWRGDHFEDELRAAIVAWDIARHAEFFARCELEAVS